MDKFLQTIVGLVFFNTTPDKISTSIPFLSLLIGLHFLFGMAFGTLTSLTTTDIALNAFFTTGLMCSLIALLLTMLSLRNRILKTLTCLCGADIFLGIIQFSFLLLIKMPLGESIQLITASLAFMVFIWGLVVLIYIIHKSTELNKWLSTLVGLLLFFIIYSSQTIPPENFTR